MPYTCYKYFQLGYTVYSNCFEESTTDHIMGISESRSDHEENLPDEDVGIDKWADLSPDLLRFHDAILPLSSRPFFIDRDNICLRSEPKAHTGSLQDILNDIAQSESKVKKYPQKEVGFSPVPCTDNKCLGSKSEKHTCSIQDLLNDTIAQPQRNYEVKIILCPQTEEVGVSLIEKKASPCMMSTMKASLMNMLT